jgi:glycerate dehydrogenase
MVLVAQRRGTGMQGVFLDSETIDQQDLDFSVLTSTLKNWQLYGSTKPSQIGQRIENADIVITNKVSLNATLLQQAPRLRYIGICATGTDNVDVAMANSLGITVCNVKAYSTASVIQHTIGLLIALASKIVDYHQLVKEGEWINAKYFCLQNYRTMELEGKTLGIVGYGAIGQGVANVASQLGMKILIAKREGQNNPSRMLLKELLTKVDVLSLHCPLNEQTRNMIGVNELALMKKGAILLNVSRGGLIDEQALAQSLASGHLAGAGLDVVSNEPPGPSNPLFKKLPNLIITPHVAWASVEARKRLLHEVAENIKNFINGSPRNVIK